MSQPLSILLVEDDEVDRLAVRRALRQTGWPDAEVTEGWDADIAIAALVNGRFDCALVDYNLPHGTALDVIQQARAADVRTPIIVLTGQGDEQIAVNLMKAGASDYIIKGQITVEHLQKSLRYVLRLGEAERETEAATADLNYLVAVSASLSASLDFEETVEAILTTVLSHIADYVAIYFRDEEGVNLTRLASRHRDPARLPLLDRWLDRHLDRTSPRWGGDYLGNATDVVFKSAARGEPPIAAITTALRGRERDLGFIVMVRDPAAEPHSAREMALASEVAHRCALALDNARLYRLAREATQMRDAFLSIASHELKGPITTIQGYADLLLRRYGGENERERRMIGTLGSQARRLNILLESLFDLSRIERGQLAIARSDLDFHSLVTQFLSEVQLTATDHAIEFQYEPEHNYRLWGDAVRLEQVLRNLIQNAIKYSPNNTPIRLSLLRRDQSVELAVQDQGIGIPPEAVPHLFERFYRAPGAASQEFKGAGLGLFVVHEIVRQHGGTIQIESEVGSGSRFIVRLPTSDGPRLTAADGEGDARQAEF